MGKTTVDVDPELLAAAKARLGTSTIKDTINAALREIAERGAREEAINALTGMVHDGTLDWQQLDDKRSYRPTPKETEHVDTEDVRLMSAPQPQEDRRRYRVFEVKSHERSIADLGQSGSASMDRMAAWRSLNATLNVLNIPTSESLSLGAFHNHALFARLRDAGKPPMPLLDFQGIQETREAIKRLLIQHTSLGPHPDAEARETLQSVHELLEEIEALSEAARKAASEAAE